jgi:hypothetical protein
VVRFQVVHFSLKATQSKIHAYVDSWVVTKGLLGKVNGKNKRTRKKDSGGNI